MVISHLGRPKGEKNNKLSLSTVYKFLKENLKTNVYFYMSDINEETKISPWPRQRFTFLFYQRTQSVQISSTSKNNIYCIQPNKCTHLGTNLQTFNDYLLLSPGQLLASLCN